MIVDNLDIRRSGCVTRPLEAYPPLTIDPNAELACSIALQSFKPIAPQRTKFVQARSRIKNFHASIRLTRETLKLSNKTAVSESSRAVVLVAQDHRDKY
jgi:hypothetical protein